MYESTLQIGLFLLTTVALGVVIGWLIRGHRLTRLNDDWQTKLDDVIRERDRHTVEIGTLRSTIEDQQALVHKHETAVANIRISLESAHAKEKMMSKDIFTLRAEREDFKNKVLTFQNALVSVKDQFAEFQAEFVKARQFYKGELAKSFEKRKALEEKIENAKLEHQSFSNLLQATRSEHESANKMLASARNRLSGLDELEQKVIELEAENAQLNHDARLTRQEVETLQRDIAEFDELKVQNQELAHCVKAMEGSRKQYEDNAQRYRENAGQSEQRSETLRIRLDEVEKNFADMERQQRKALKEVRKATIAENAPNPRKKEVDDLQEIIGIGRVFEMALHDLGIFSFRQIADFGVPDIARVNLALKEFKGRMEQDDWIGQAKDLLYKKYAGKTA